MDLPFDRPLVQLRINRQTYQQFLESLNSTPLDQLGRMFLATHFPGHEDPDVSEERDVNVATGLIEERYVQP